MTLPALRVGILGTARIARGFVQGVQSSPSVTVTAVASRDAGKAAHFADQLNIPRRFGSYAALLADPEIDAIYNPLPNSLHAEWSINALSAGKHVLCEKPLSANASEARSMIEAARRHGVYLVEGYPYLAQPQTLKLRELVAAGVIGKPRLIQGSFGFTLNDRDDIRLTPALAGGALMDIGVYPLSLIRVIAGQRPTRVSATAQWADAGGVDRAMAATLEFATGLLAQITCSFDSCVHRQAMIAGTGGVIQTTYLNHTSAQQPGDLLLRVGSDKSATDSVVRTPAINGFLAEAESFARMVRAGPSAWTGATAEESVDIMMMVDAIVASARSGRTVLLA
jgi:D-xylose 1-dehydrogenase (NADP+, D-xylono-1,5-lactone-forming)